MFHRFGKQNTRPCRETKSRISLAIALLPFEDFIAENDKEYFVKEVPKELLNLLASMGLTKPD